MKREQDRDLGERRVLATQLAFELANATLLRVLALLGPRRPGAVEPGRRRAPPLQELRLVEPLAPQERAEFLGLEAGGLDDDAQLLLAAPVLRTLGRLFGFRHALHATRGAQPARQRRLRDPALARQRAGADAFGARHARDHARLESFGMQHVDAHLAPLDFDDRAPHGGRHALRACPAEPIPALRAATGPLNRRGDNYPDTGGPGANADKKSAFTLNARAHRTTAFVLAGSKAFGIRMRPI